MPTTVQLRKRLVDKLKELFQLDQPDLDFGFYRIMHAKSAQITEFLEKDLLQVIEDSFGKQSGEKAVSARDKAHADLEAALGAGALDENGKLKEAFAETPAGKAYVAAIAAADAAKEAVSAEGEIYDHLYRFFERYYEDGDFISRRYMNRETEGRAAPFAIPYNGEEVKLHWANADQYYIKTGEYFSNFTVDLAKTPEVVGKEGELGLESSDGPMPVHFRLVDAAEGEHGNVKATDATKRFFILHAEDPIGFNDAGELELRFEYRPDPEKSGQDGTWQQKRRDEACSTLLEKLPGIPEAVTYHRLLAAKLPTDKNKDRTLLEKYLHQYTARNTSDYFIHKDLGSFLSRELDFYIKNEVMRLDDIENEDAPRVESYLAKLKVLRTIARQLIDFLAQLENFQKKLWLKKKFVTETNYCITLDRIQEDLYPEIAANDAQREEWVRLYAIDQIEGNKTDDLLKDDKPGYSSPLSAEFLKSQPYLVLDSRHFDNGFKARLVASIEPLEEQCGGLLVNAENFQALSLLTKRYQGAVSALYLDPPYNTGEQDFYYKDSYQHSSWLSFMESRLRAAVPLMSGSANLCVSIDDNESANLRSLLDDVFGHGLFVADIAYERSGSSGLGQGGKIVNTKEHIFSYSFDKTSLNDVFYEREIEFKTLKRYAKILVDPGARTQVDSFIAPSTGEEVKIFKHDSPEIGSISLRDFAKRKTEILEEYRASFEKVYRLTSVQAENEFQQKILKICKNGFYSADYLVSRGRHAGKMLTLFYVNGQIMVWLKDSSKIVSGKIVKANKITDHWSHVEIPKADLANEGGVTLQRGKKPEQLLKRLVDWMSNEGDLILDFFGGTATTAAVAAKCRRKFLITEAEDYFDDKTLTRMKNVLAGDPTGISTAVNWKGGGAFRYIRLESYEDTLNNLNFAEDKERKKALKANDALRRDYTLNYMLDVETRGSASLLNIENFTDPAAYTLKVKKPGATESVEQPVDLIETFNFLIGLRVENLAAPQTFSAKFQRVPDADLPEGTDTRLQLDGKLKQDEKGAWWFRKVEGWVPKDRENPNNGQREKVLIVWRKLTGNAEEDNLMLDEWFQKNRLSTRDFEFDTIYVNGSNNLPNLKLDGDTWKVRLLEEEFHKAMWDVQDI